MPIISSINLRKSKQKAKEWPRKCPKCKSQVLGPLDERIKEDGNIIFLSGWVCLKCGMKNARRTI